ncbi:MAG: hypothetical protein AB1797_12180 [bacterium]
MWFKKIVAIVRHHRIFDTGHWILYPHQASRIEHRASRTIWLRREAAL